MAIGILAAALGLLLGTAAIVIPRIVNRHNNPDDHSDSRAYLANTGPVSGGNRPGQPQPAGPAGQQCRVSARRRRGRRQIGLATTRVTAAGPWLMRVRWVVPVPVWLYRARLGFVFGPLPAREVRPRPQPPGEHCLVWSANMSLPALCNTVTPGNASWEPLARAARW